jgi:hypothetical protein
LLQGARAGGEGGVVGQVLGGVGALQPVGGARVVDGDGGVSGAGLQDVPRPEPEEWREFLPR